MQRWCDRVALVTGASAGIGAGICRELVKHGVIVIGCARNFQKLKDLTEEEDIKASPGKLYAIKCDLTQESEIIAMFSDIRAKFGRLDICINNAGFSSNSPLLSGETSDWRSMLEVNVLALCICSREAVKIMKEKGINDGQVIQISSIGGHRLPTTTSMSAFNFYCATKFMVRALTQGLRLELRETDNHIRVSSVSPGLVETEFLSRTFDPDVAESVYSSTECLQPKDVADAVLYILQAPPYVQIEDIIVQPTTMSS